jgi:hypothetical protein
MPFITQILLPKRDNMGRPFARKHYQSFQSRMMRAYGGWTRKGQAEGAWLSPAGKLHQEEHWVYEVVHARRDARLWQAEKERLKAELEQEDIWIIQYEGRVL